MPVFPSLEYDQREQQPSDAMPRDESAEQPADGSPLETSRRRRRLEGTSATLEEFTQVPVSHQYIDISGCFCVIKVYSSLSEKYCVMLLLRSREIR